MIIDDPYFTPFEIASLEIHLYLCRSLPHLRTGDDFIVSEKSGKRFLGSRIWKEDDRFLGDPPDKGGRGVGFSSIREYSLHSRIQWNRYLSNSVISASEISIIERIS